MGKSTHIYTAPQGARRSPPKCVGHCGRRVLHGDRCPDCARELRQRKRRNRR